MITPPSYTHSARHPLRHCEERWRRGNRNDGQRGKPGNYGLPRPEGLAVTVESRHCERSAANDPRRAPGLRAHAANWASTGATAEKT
jgi:hypothetical protein